MEENKKANKNTKSNEFNKRRNEFYKLLNINIFNNSSISIHFANVYSLIISGSNILENTIKEPTEDNYENKYNEYLKAKRFWTYQETTRKWENCYDRNEKMLQSVINLLLEDNFDNIEIINWETFINSNGKLKNTFLKMQTSFDCISKNNEFGTLSDIFRFLAKSVGLSLTNENNIKERFGESFLKNSHIRYSFKDSLNPNISNNIVYQNLAMILSLPRPSNWNFTILDESFSKKLDNCLLETEAVADKFDIIINFLKQNISTDIIPFSNELMYLFVIKTRIDITCNKICKVLTAYCEFLDRIRNTLKKYAQNEIPVEHINMLTFILLHDTNNTSDVDNMLKDARKELEGQIAELNKTKKSMLNSFEIAIPDIADYDKEQNEISEFQANETYILEIVENIETELKHNEKSIARYYAFVSNIRMSNNFDHLWYIIESLAKMPYSISNNFIDIFMSKFNNEKTQSHIKTNISLDDLKDLINTIHLSGKKLEKLATIHFSELTNKEWNFLYHLPIIENENKEWFKDFYTMLKIYCK